MIKLKNKVLIGAMSIFILISVGSCETTELDLLDSPNTLAPSQGSVDLFLNAIQIGFADFLEQVTEEAAEVTRMKHMFGPTYASAYGPTTFDGHWVVYSGLMADARAMVPLAEEQGLFIHAGIAKVLEAYVMVTLVDNFADVPYSEALDANILNPKVDSGKDIYDAMYLLIDDAIADFNKVSVGTPASDLIYNGNKSKWIKFANSLKLKMYLTTGLVNASASTAGINSLIAEGNLISSSSDDMEFQWGTNILSPDSRHPNYGPNYDNGSSSNDYMSTYFMYNIVLGKSVEDPRRRYYFYRQVNTNTSDVNEQSCITKPKPGHYELSDQYCNIQHPGDSNGYWGRDHGNADGIPPDSFLKTTFGLYPVGGQFDANQAAPVKQGMGGQGAGISPVMLKSYVHFMRAAAALELGTTDNARVQLEAGIRASMAKVTGFLPDVSRGGFDATLAADIEAYVNQVLTNATTGYDNASAAGKLEIVIKEYYLALFGNGIEAYNNYRRTGYPSNLQPTILATPGPYIRSFIYPSNFVNVNSVVSQKADNTMRVFWDTNPNPLK
jgi:hypothetical protein